MDWCLYDNGLSHERINWIWTFCRYYLNCSLQVEVDIVDIVDSDVVVSPDKKSVFRIFWLSSIYNWGKLNISIIEETMT